MGRLDFVTVFYDRELPMIAMQMRSFRRFMSREGLGHIIAVWNSSESGDVVRSRFGPMLRDALGDLAPHLVLLAREEVAAEPTLAGISGWHSQQVLKLAAAWHVTAPVYCVLDAKNHFIAPTTIDVFLTADGRPISEPFDFRGAKNFRTCLVNSFHYFGVEPTEDNIGRALPTTTPLPMITAAVRDMMDSVVARAGAPFGDAFLRPPLGENGTTEFLLYAAYMASLGPLDEPYAFAPPRHVTFFSKAPSSPEGFARAMQRVTHADTVMLGMHKARLAKISERDRDFFRRLWVERGLFETDAEARQFVDLYM